MDATLITTLTTALSSGNTGVALFVAMAIAIYWLAKQNEKIRDRSDKLTDQVAQERVELQAMVNQLTQIIIQAGLSPESKSKGESA